MQLATHGLIKPQLADIFAFFAMKFRLVQTIAECTIQYDEYVSLVTIKNGSVSTKYSYILNDDMSSVCLRRMAEKGEVVNLKP